MGYGYKVLIFWISFKKIFELGRGWMYSFGYQRTKMSEWKMKGDSLGVMQCRICGLRTKVVRGLAENGLFKTEMEKVWGEKRERSRPSK